MRRPLLAAPNLPRLPACMPCHATGSTSYSLAAAAAASRSRHVIVARALRVMRAAEKNRCRDQVAHQQIGGWHSTPSPCGHRHKADRTAWRSSSDTEEWPRVARLLRAGSRFCMAVRTKDVHVLARQTEMNSDVGWAEQGINHLSGNRRGARAKSFWACHPGREKWGGAAETAVPGPATCIASHHFAAVDDGLRFMRGGQRESGMGI